MASGAPAVTRLPFCSATGRLKHPARCHRLTATGRPGGNSKRARENEGRTAQGARPLEPQYGTNGVGVTHSVAAGRFIRPRQYVPRLWHVPLPAAAVSPRKPFVRPRQADSRVAGLSRSGSTHPARGTQPSHVSDVAYVKPSYDQRKRKPPGDMRGGRLTSLVTSTPNSRRTQRDRRESVSGSFRPFLPPGGCG